MLPESRERGYKPGRFSFNVKGGRCEACQGDGLKRIEMNFLPDVYVTCDVCRGRRYNHETLQVKYKGYSIADLLEATVEEALRAAGEHPADQAQAADAGATSGWATSTWGSRRPRFRAARRSASSWRKELSKRQTGTTFYMLDEPTTGLHFDDVRKLLDVLQRLVDLGNTVVVIEHQPGRDQDRGLDHRPGAGRRRRRRRGGGRRHAGAGRAQPRKKLHGAKRLAKCCRASGKSQ